MGQKKEISEKLNELKATDVYSLLLFAIYKLSDNPKYSTLSELSYILDKDNLLKFLTYYGGKTISIPTLEELSLLLDALFLYNYVNLNNLEFAEAIKLLDKTNSQQKEVIELYKVICNILSKYNFKRN